MIRTPEKIARIIGALGAAWVMTSCTPTKPQPVERPAIVVEISQRQDIGKQRLNQELDNLPDSVIKSLLTTRVKPLFSPNPPKSMTYEGLNIKISDPLVILKTVNTNSVSGFYTPRDSSGIRLESLYPTKEDSLRIPYLYLVLDSEKTTIPASNLSKDGTPFVDMTFPTDQALYEGLRPVITITTPDPSVVKTEYKQLYRNFERFAYIKEASSMLLVDLFITETVKKMNALGLSTTVETKTSGGEKKQAEALIQSLVGMNNLNGRLNAAFDIAGYLLAFKATEKTELNDPNNMDSSFLKVRPLMQTVDLGVSPQDILSRSLRWAITTPDADKYLTHVGNLKNIP